MKNREIAFNALINEVLECTVCSRMACSKRVLNHGCGPLNSPVMVIGEAPGRLGADSSELPFHGDQAGRNFEDLIRLAGLSRSELFITNAVLCNPKDERGNNAAPLGSEISACSRFLKKQIDLLNPAFVVTLGSVALKAISFVEPHSVVLRDAVRTAVNWHGRVLVPLYHPGQRAMIHRSFANQSADYQFLAELVRRARERKRNAPSSPSRADATALANEILSQLGPISYFALHKLCFLAEVRHMEKYGRRITGSYYVRQKDGPYCVDLHPARLKKAGLNVAVVGGGNKPYVTKASGGLFDEMDAPALDESAALIVKTVIEKYAGLSDEKLKTAAYLAGPMRRILKLERLGAPQFNAPVFVP